MEQRLETLSTILTSQVEDGRKRDEWMSAILQELVSSRRPTDGGAVPDTSLPNTNVPHTPRQPHLPPCSTLVVICILEGIQCVAAKIRRIRETHWCLVSPSADQTIALVSMLDDDWTRTLRYGLDLDDQASLQETLAAMETHLRRQRNVMVDRRDFYS